MCCFQAKLVQRVQDENKFQLPLDPLKALRLGPWVEGWVETEF